MCIYHLCILGLNDLIVSASHKTASFDFLAIHDIHSSLHRSYKHLAELNTLVRFHNIFCLHHELDLGTTDCPEHVVLLIC